MVVGAEVGISNDQIWQKLASMETKLSQVSETVVEVRTAFKNHLAEDQRNVARARWSTGLLLGIGVPLIVIAVELGIKFFFNK